MAAAASNDSEDRLLDVLNAEQRTMLLCCCCGRTVRDPVLLRCLHGCCLRCATQLRKEEEMETAVGRAASTPAIGDAGATRPLPESTTVRPGMTSLIDPVVHGVPPGAAARCRTCGEPLLLAADGAERRNYFLAAILHSILVEKRYERPAQPSCDLCTEAHNKNAAAAFWCAKCSRNLCSHCELLHSILKVKHKASLCPLSCNRAAEPSLLSAALSPLPAVSCSTHVGRSCRAVCLTCTQVACDICVQTCRDRQHDVQNADDRKVFDEVDVRRKEVLSTRTSLCDQQSLLVEHQSEASRRRAEDAREAYEALAVRRQALFDAVGRACDALVEHYRKAAASAVIAPELERNVQHLLAYSNAFASFADNLVLLEQHKVVTAHLTTLKKVLEKATRDANEACKEGQEGRCLHELALAPPAGEDELLEAVMHRCLLGHAQQLPEVLQKGPGSTGSGCSRGRLSGH